MYRVGSSVGVHAFWWWCFVHHQLVGSLCVFLNNRNLGVGLGWRDGMLDVLLVLCVFGEVAPSPMGSANEVGCSSDEVG